LQQSAMLTRFCLSSSDQKENCTTGWFGNFTLVCDQCLSINLVF